MFELETISSNEKIMAWDPVSSVGQPFLLLSSPETECRQVSWKHEVGLGLAKGPAPLPIPREQRNEGVVPCRQVVYNGVKWLVLPACIKHQDQNDATSGAAARLLKTKKSTLATARWPYTMGCLLHLAFVETCTCRLSSRIFPSGSRLVLLREGQF